VFTTHANKVNNEMTITVNNPTKLVKGHPTKQAAGHHSDKRDRRQTRRTKNQRAIGEFS
jgi:hypothetical protein